MKVFLNSACPCGSGKKYKDCCLKEFTSKFSTSINGFPIDLVEKGADFIVNRKGAVVYMDESKQPILDLQEGSTVKTVLSLGMSKSQKPMATIQENDGAICYILPNSYFEWCQTCIKMSMNGMNLFPSDVKFTKHKDEYFVDVL